MGLNSLQVCMETPDWRHLCQGADDEVRVIDSSSPSEEPMIERRLKPPQDQALKCPRCDSTHTKFCYYNNYSLSQPRYFCKTCRRYWTKGGSLRNVPVGGGCRKNKKAATKKLSDPPPNPHLNISQNAPDLHLSFSELQLAHLNAVLGNSGNTSLMDCRYDTALGNPRHVDFMDNKLDAVLGNSTRSYAFMGSSDNSGHLNGGVGDVSHGFSSSSLHGLYSPLGFSLDGNQGSYMGIGEKMFLPFGGSEDPNTVDVKPSNKLLSLGWQDQGCSEVGKDPLGYLMNDLGSW